MKTNNKPSFGMAVKTTSLAKDVMRNTIQKRKDVQTLNRIINQQINNPIDIFIRKSNNKFNIEAEVGHKTFKRGLFNNWSPLTIIKKAANFADELNNIQLDARANKDGGFTIINRLPELYNNN